MATFPAKTNYAAGNVLTAAQMVDIGEQINALNGNAGKNKIINGDFNIWQRGTSITIPSGVWTYHCDRFSAYQAYSAGSLVVSRQTFTPGTAPVAGYEGQYFLRFTAPTTTSTELNFRQSIENVQTLAGQTATLSFWAKASTNLNLNTKLTQDFGSGGSGRVDSSVTTHAITTSWTRFTMTVSVASIAGKTVGTSSFFDAYFYTDFAGFASGRTLDIWGVQVEAGNVATAFQTATGTLAGELQAAQRYYYRATSTAVYQMLSNFGTGKGTTQALISLKCPTTMRVTPTSVDYANIAIYDYTNVAIGITSMAIETYASPFEPFLTATVASGVTVYRPYAIISNNTIGGYIGVSAEL